MGVGPTMTTLGLGDAELIDKLSVRWPTGEVQEFTDVRADQRILITEGADSLESTKVRLFDFSGRDQ